MIENSDVGSVCARLVAATAPVSNPVHARSAICRRGATIQSFSPVGNDEGRAIFIRFPTGAQPFCAGAGDWALGTLIREEAEIARLQKEWVGWYSGRTATPYSLSWLGFRSHGRVAEISTRSVTKPVEVFVLSVGYPIRFRVVVWRFGPRVVWKLAT